MRLLLIMALAFPALAESPPEETVVSTETCSGLWIVPLVWSPEDREPRELTAVFDTGGSNSFIDPDAIERISGQRVEEGKRARMEDLTVAGRSFQVFRPEVKDLDHLSRALGRRLDVFLPFQAFAGFLLVLDYPAGEMRIRRGELPESDGEAVFDARGRDDRPWLEVKVGRLERRLLIDSGSSGSIAVKPHRKLDFVDDPVPLRLFQGMYDVELAEVGRLDGDARIGSLTFARPLVTLTDDTELLGVRVLRHFVLTFDQANRRVRLDPATNGPVATEPYRGVGAVFLPREDGFEIAHVVPGSPAEAAGLIQGEMVTHRDGVPVLDRGCRDLDRAMPDSTNLTVLRDGLAVDIVLIPTVLVR